MACGTFQLGVSGEVWIADCERNQSAMCNYDHCKETPDVDSRCLDAGAQLQGASAWNKVRSDLSFLICFAVNRMFGF